MVDTSQCRLARPWWRIAGTMALATALVLAFVPAAPLRAAEGHDLVAIRASALAFRIDRHEVTIGQFRKFMTATGTRTKAERDGGGSQYLGGWQRMAGWTWDKPYGTPGRDDEPAVHVTYDEADAYCRWAGLRLPRDAEWVAAAYTETRASPLAPFVAGRRYRYPTGDSPDTANQMDSKARHTRLGPAEKLGHGGGHVAVRTTAPGVNGLFDMGANVWEWVDEGAGDKRTRGGSWWYGPAQMQADAVYDKPRGFAAVYVGFRCVGD